MTGLVTPAAVSPVGDGVVLIGVFVAARKPKTV
jgi:hypothetical protein